MILKLENITAGYRKGVDVLDDISLNVDLGETLAVIGQNGSGKSTLAKAIMNTLPFKKGKVWWKNQDITSMGTEEIVKFKIGYFPQGGRVFPHLSIADNLKISGHLLSKSELDNRLNEMRDIFPVLFNYKGKKQASELSGGEKHQLSLCMVMLNKPEFLILDEPSAGLSPQNTRILYEQLQNLYVKYFFSILLIEQNVSEAITRCDKLIKLSNGKIANTFLKEELNKKSLDGFLFEKLVFLD